ncbi:hypothetical protein Q7P37_001462 [Cladosporium fusiforme]
MSGGMNQLYLPFQFKSSEHSANTEAQIEEHKHGLMDKLFHHKDKHEDSSTEENTQQQMQGAGSSAKPEQHKHEETKKEKFEDYMEKDKEMEAEGKEYGGLM